MLNTTNSNSEYLHNYIRKVAKQEQESVDISSVYTGTIEAAQSGIYTIVLNQSDKSSSVLAIPIVTGDVYDKDDSVYLLRANTTATVNYFIVGKVNAIQEAFFNLTELERFNPNESKADLSFGDNDFISISENINNIFDSINELGYFQLEVKITSKVEDNDKIIIYLNYTDESHYGAKFVFSSYEFIGQPGGNNYTLVQKKIFHLPSNIDIKNIRIEKVGDFSVAAMNIVAGSLLEVSAAYQNDIVVQNDRNYFEKEIPNVSNPLNTVTLTSKIYYNNKPLVGEALQYYWFLKDDSAVDPTSSDYYNIEGAGNGWRCLNTFTLATTADEEKIRLWDNKNNFIVLNKTNEFVNFSNFVNKVKCIVKYFDNFIESDLIDIYNYDYEQFSAILQSTVDNSILAYKDDKIILQCEVLNDNEKIDNSKYSIEHRWYIKGRNADESDLNITAKNEKNEDILTYSSLTIYDSAYTNTLQKGEYKLAKGKTEEEFYCVVTIIPKGTKEGYHSEQTNIVKVSSNAAAADITQNTEYKYYISNEHNITFSQRIKQEEGQLSEWNGDWVINITGAIWVGPAGVDYNTVFSSFDIFNQYKEDEEQFVYYTQRNVWRERGEVFKTENWSFPQIARSVINVNGWKNHRVGDNVNQLNTFNQLSDNGKEDGIYYADIAKITTDDTPDWGTKYYERSVSLDGEISYTLISLEATIHFKKDQNYYIYNSEKEQYELVLSNTDYDKSTEYYEKINDNEYQKLVVNTQNFDITNVAWPSNKAGPFYTNIDNKLLINASYIRSGTLEVKDKFYASIDQDNVRIGGFIVNNDSLQSLGENPAVILSPEQIKVGDFFQASETGASFTGSVTISGGGARDELNQMGQTVTTANENATEAKQLANNGQINKIRYYIYDKDGVKRFEASIPPDTGKLMDYKGGWLETIITYNDGHKITSRLYIGDDGLPGKDGKYIVSIIEQYCLANNAPAHDDSGWIDITENSVIPIKKGKLRFRQQKYIWHDSSVTYSTVRMDETDQRIVKWCAETDTALIDGGSIYAHSISSSQLATDALASLNYPHKDANNKNVAPSSDNGGIEGNKEIFSDEIYFSNQGSFFDLEQGNIYSPHLILTDDNLYIDGEVSTEKGNIGGLLIEKKLLHSKNYEIGFFGGEYKLDDLSAFVPSIDSSVIPGIRTPLVLFAGASEQLGVVDFASNSTNIKLEMKDAPSENNNFIFTCSIPNSFGNIKVIDGTANYGTDTDYNGNFYSDLTISIKNSKCNFNTNQTITGLVRVSGAGLNSHYFLQYTLPDGVGEEMVTFNSFISIPCPNFLDADRNEYSINLKTLKGRYRWRRDSEIYEDSGATPIDLLGVLKSNNSSFEVSSFVQQGSEDPAYFNSHINLYFPDYITPGAISGQPTGCSIDIVFTEIEIEISNLIFELPINRNIWMFLLDLKSNENEIYFNSEIENCKYFDLYAESKKMTNNMFTDYFLKMTLNEENTKYYEPFVKFKYYNDVDIEKIEHDFYVTSEGNTHIKNAIIDEAKITKLNMSSVNLPSARIDHVACDEIYLYNYDSTLAYLFNDDGLYFQKANPTISTPEYILNSNKNNKTVQFKTTEEYGFQLLTNKKDCNITGLNVKIEGVGYNENALLQGGTTLISSYAYNTRNEYENKQYLIAKTTVQAQQNYYHNDDGYTAKSYAKIELTATGPTSPQNNSASPSGNREGVTKISLSAKTITTNTTITQNSSDKNLKHDIQLQPESYTNIFDKLKPVIFKYNDGSSNRYHTGLIAQDLEQAITEAGLTSQDLAALCYEINKETGQKEQYSIRYTELISMCIYEIQKNKARIKELEDKLNEIKGDN